MNTKYILTLILLTLFIPVITFASGGFRLAGPDTLRTPVDNSCSGCWGAPGPTPINPEFLLSTTYDFEPNENNVSFNDVINNPISNGQKYLRRDTPLSSTGQYNATLVCDLNVPSSPTGYDDDISFGIGPNIGVIDTLTSSFQVLSPSDDPIEPPTTPQPTPDPTPQPTPTPTPQPTPDPNTSIDSNLVLEVNAVPSRIDFNSPTTTITATAETINDPDTAIHGYELLLPEGFILIDGDQQQNPDTQNGLSQAIWEISIDHNNPPNVGQHSIGVAVTDGTTRTEAFVSIIYFGRRIFREVSP